MRAILCSLACLFSSMGCLASTCNGSQLIIHNASSNPLTIKEIDTSGRILFMPEHFSHIENLFPGTTIQKFIQNHEPDKSLNFSK